MQFARCSAKSICSDVNGTLCIFEGAMEQDKPERQEDITKVQGEISLWNDRFNNLSVERRVVLNDYLDMKGNIHVFCRIRPLQDEIHRQESLIVTSNSSKVILKTAKSKSKKYCFDKVFHPSSTQCSKNYVCIYVIITKFQR